MPGRSSHRPPARAAGGRYRLFPERKRQRARQAAGQSAARPQRTAVFYQAVFRFDWPRTFQKLLLRKSIHGKYNTESGKNQ